MRSTHFAAVAAASLLAGDILAAQGRGGGSEWLTTQGDAQRTSWIRTDPFISVETVSKPGFDLQWKTQLENQPRQLSSLAQGVSANAVTLFVPMSLVTASSNNVFAIDNDTGYVVWRRHFDAPLPAAATAECPGGITAPATRIVNLAPPPLPTPRAAAAGNTGAGGGARGSGYRGSVGQPGEGVPVETNARGAGAGPGRGTVPPVPPAPPVPGTAAAAGTQPAPANGGAPSGVGPAAGAAAAPAAAEGGRAAGPQGTAQQAARGGNRGGAAAANAGIPGAPGGGGPAGGYGRPGGVVYVVSSDGVLHVLGLPSGKDMQKPAPLVPADARASDLTAVNDFLYAATSSSCGGAPNGIWAVDLASDTKPVTSWKTNGGSVVGAVAFATDGTLLAAIGPGQSAAGGYANAIVALDPKTLVLKDWYTDPTAAFVSAPLVFRMNDKEIVAAATRDGRVLLLDAASLGGSNHATPMYASRPLTRPGTAFAPEALAMWQDTTQWLLVPISGPLAADVQLPATNGRITNGAVLALRIVDSSGKPSLQPGWVSRDLAGPVTPIVVNGVVFAAASGRPELQAGMAAADLARRGKPAMLYALDGASGKELWTSGKTITSFMSGRSLWSASGQVYVGTFDGMVYAFGLAMERH